MRQVDCCDAVQWLKDYEKKDGHSMVLSIPDISEFSGWSEEKYKEFFINVSKLALEKTGDHDVTIFYQSDIKTKNGWLSKAFLAQLAAHELQIPLVWHKVIGRVPPDIATFGRPSYTHILAFSKSFKPDHGKSTPDIISHVGKKLWERGMGLNAAKMIVKFLKNDVKSVKIINLFCGLGILLDVCDAYEIDSLGIELSRKRAEEAMNNKFAKDEID